MCCQQPVEILRENGAGVCGVRKKSTWATTLLGELPIKDQEPLGPRNTKITIRGHVSGSQGKRLREDGWCLTWEKSSGIGTGVSIGFPQGGDG